MNAIITDKVLKSGNEFTFTLENKDYFVFEIPAKTTTYVEPGSRRDTWINYSAPCDNIGIFIRNIPTTIDNNIFAKIYVKTNDSSHYAEIGSIGKTSNSVIHVYTSTALYPDYDISNGYLAQPILCWGYND